jgi:serine/threonine-protein kinase
VRRVFVAVAAGIVVVAAVLGGCSAAGLPVSSAAPGATVAPDRLDSIFLTPEEVNPLMGTDSMQISVPINPGPYTKNLETMADQDCRSTDSPALGPVYEGSGYTAISTEMMVGDQGRRLTQAVAVFPSADLAQAFVANLAAKWKACAGRTIKAQMIPTIYGGIYSEQTFTLGSYLGGADAIGLSRTTTDGYQCQRALLSDLNVVVDVDACTSPLDRQGRTIANKMSAKAEAAAS